MKEESGPQCASCDTKVCGDGIDCFDVGDRCRARYREDDQIRKLHATATAIEARHYCREPRIREIVLFAKELGCRRIGLAFCIGLADEAKVIADVLSRDFEVASVCCKVCGISKDELKLERISPDREVEVMCNPVGQAELLNQAGSDLNVLCGLCVGHDAIFSMASKAPVTTLIAKDRVLAHNPIGAVYSRYIREHLADGREEEEA